MAVFLYLKMRFYLILSVLLFLVSCGEEKKDVTSDLSFDHSVTNQDPTPSLKLFYNYLNIKDSSSHFRGLFNVRESFFISGTNGKIISIKDELHESELNEAKFTDLRDIHILGDGSVLVMGIASPGKIWKKSKDDSDFHEVYSNSDSLVFMDGMDFWNDSVGLVYGDPLDGYHFLLKTIDGGENWSRISSSVLPEPLSNESGFAASGTGVQCIGNGVAYVGFGGDTARILKTEDYGNSWEVINTPLLSGKGGKGIYSLAFKDKNNGVVVGGHWENPQSDSSKAYTIDGGVTWLLSKGIQEYRSCVTYINEEIYISTGTAGTDISYNGGRNWMRLDTIGFNSILFNTQSKGMAVGNYGTIAKIKLR